MPAIESDRVTRLAPSPTGALHLGNARTFLINWAMARQRGWRIILRIEDLDGPRIKPGADQQAVEDLTWLGLDWDTQAPHQTADLTPYRRALRHLQDRGLTYHCTCTRREIEGAQSAPHNDDNEMRYPGTCRAAARPPGDATAVRVMIPDEAIEYEDQWHGSQSVNVQQQVGDFVVATKAGLPSYQLAVVIDDARQGITDVVRGDDLLASTGRQLWLYRMLDLTPLPRYWHLPLVVGEDGRRLAKRHGDTRIAHYREQGVDPQRVIGLLAFWCGAAPCRQPMDAAEFRDAFDVTRLPREPMTFSAEDDQWLTASV